MKRSLLLLSLIAGSAQAYEFRLTFATPFGARNVAVAGYAIDDVAGTVTGTCSYTRCYCIGRICHCSANDGVCTWDLYGNLLGRTAGFVAAPESIATNGTETIYATDGVSTTGRDSRGYGFVDTPSSHYTWQTASGTIAVIGDAPTAFTATLVSDGDFDLQYAGASVTPQVYGTITPTPGTATVISECGSSVPVGATCDVTVLYDPTSISCTSTGLAYTGIDVAVSSDAPPPAVDWWERFTVSAVPVCDD